MKNITIGLVGPDWEPRAATRYYAERSGSGEYAFGSTPAEALAQLEAREAAIATGFDEGLAEEIAFLALGVADFLSGRRDAGINAHGDYMRIIGEVIRQAPLLVEYWKRVEVNGFGGVWLYDVTRRFGQEWAEEVLAGSNQSPAERLECIIEDEIEKWS
ncbi:hypothetical protein OS176_01625 [Xanthomonadaceae bacterium XH05]|nr:hypothetical protein [Xanthomonadaceae bacterium XH05]